MWHILGDSALKVLIRVLMKGKSLLPFIRDQIQREFMQSSSEQDAILRGNCIATRIMTCFSMMVGSSWIYRCLKGTVSLLLKEEAPWTLSTSKIASGSEEEKLKKVEASCEAMVKVATKFLRKLRELLEKAPREIRCMCYYIWIQAKTFAPDKAILLIGGYLFLRVLNPAIVSPNNVPNLFPTDQLPLTYKQNSIALCRLLQNLSNRKKYSESGQDSLNGWLEQNVEPLEAFLLEMAEDPLRKEDERPFLDFSSSKMVIEKDLKQTLTDEQWETLHVALCRSVVSVQVKLKLAPVIGAVSPTRHRGSNSNIQVGTSLPASPSRSRSHSTRIVNESEELSIYGDGKMRLRQNRRGSLGGSLFQSSGSSSQESSGTVTPNSKSKLGKKITRNPSGSPLFRVVASSPPPEAPSSVPCSPSHASLSSPNLTNFTKPRTSSVGTGLSHEQVSSQKRSRSNSLSSQSVQELNFFDILEKIPAPYVIRRERFDELIQRLERKQLLAGGLISERRGSMKMGVGQVELLLRLALAMRHDEFGMLVESFTQTMFAEWCEKWLHIEASREVDQLLGLMVRSSYLVEKGTKSMRGYKLDLERIDEMHRLLRDKM